MSCRLFRKGSQTLKAAPPPGVSKTFSSPPWASMILRTIASPRPVPYFFVVKEGVKIHSLCCGIIPQATVRNLEEGLAPFIAGADDYRLSLGRCFENVEYIFHQSLEPVRPFDDESQLSPTFVIDPVPLPEEPGESAGQICFGVSELCYYNTLAGRGDLPAVKSLLTWELTSVYKRLAVELP